MAKISYSPQQMNIFNFIFNVCKNLVINANAGTGKTFTIVQMCIQLIARFNWRKYDILFLAFNKSIAEEINSKAIDWQKDVRGEYVLNDKGERIPVKWMKDIAEITNMHKFGLRCLNRYLRGTNLSIGTDNVDNDKYVKLAKAMISDGRTDKQETANTINKLFNLCRINLLKAGDMVAMQKLIKHHDISVDDEIIRITNELMKTAYDFNISNPVVDFTDMLVYPLALHYRNPNANIIPWYKVVFIDECQDLSRAQRELMKAAARRGRFVAVGDPNQAINGFAGANNDSFDLIAALPNTEILPLSVNYRCGKNIIRLAQEIVPSIQAADNAIDGIVRTINTIDVDTFQEGHYEEVVDEETGEITQHYVDGDMVLCRCSAPLVVMCIKLIAAGKAANVMGRDIVASIEALVKKSEAKTIKGFRTWVKTEQDRLALEIAKDKDCSKEEAKQTITYITFMDKVNCILAFAHRESNLEYIVKELKSIFTKERTKGAITFCTCHKSKGLENDRVFIIAPEKLPLEWKDQQDWEYQQEMNLKYVAITRAKKELVFVNIEQANLLSIEFNEK